MRLDRFISHATGLSRSQVHRAIKQGLVMVEGAPARSPAAAVDDRTQVCMNGQPVLAPRPAYLMLYKPAGYVCTTEGGSQPRVLDLLDGDTVAKIGRQPLQIVGRLDIDTTGLVLLTTDGAWNHRITSPASGCTKTYLVTLAEPIQEEPLRALEKGVLLKSETTPTRPCVIERRSPTQVFITLSEGRYHQVKRMFAAVGNRVVALHRVKVGKLALDPSLKPGDYRPLSTDEISAF